jgi:hypothetical protein
MDVESEKREPEGAEVPAGMESSTTANPGRRNQQQWESHREEIFEIYMMKNETLKKTMRILDEKYGFSPRYVKNIVNCFLVPLIVEECIPACFATQTKNY